MGSLYLSSPFRTVWSSGDSAGPCACTSCGATATNNPAPPMALSANLRNDMATSNSDWTWFWIVQDPSTPAPKACARLSLSRRRRGTPRRQPVQRGNQLMRVEGFGEEPVGVVVAGRRFAADEQHGDVGQRGVIADGTRQPAAVEAWKRDVADHEAHRHRPNQP